MHNSRRPLDCRTLTLTLTLTFDLIFIGGQGIVMNYPCAKFFFFILSRFGFIVRTDRITDRQTDRQTEPSAWVNSLQRIQDFDNVTHTLMFAFYSYLQTSSKSVIHTASWWCCWICFSKIDRFLSLQRLFWNQTRMTRELSPVISTSCSFIRASGRGLAP